VSEVLRHQIQLTNGYPCVRTIPGWTFHRTDDLEMGRPVLVVGERGDCQIEAQSFDVFQKSIRIIDWVRDRHRAGKCGE